jgi:hypothetical protein
MSQPFDAKKEEEKREHYPSFVYKHLLKDAEPLIELPLGLDKMDQHW